MLGALLAAMLGDRDGTSRVLAFHIVCSKWIAMTDRASLTQGSVAFGIEQDVKIIQFGVDDAETCSESLCFTMCMSSFAAIFKLPRIAREKYERMKIMIPHIDYSKCAQAEIRFCISKWYHKWGGASSNELSRPIHRGNFKGADTLS